VKANENLRLSVLEHLRNVLIPDLVKQAFAHGDLLLTGPHEYRLPND
jgi:hypothetical protein